MSGGNLYAVLVHESRDCVIDLVRNLRHLDPASSILLYNGGTDPALLEGGVHWERYGAVLHPTPRPMKWGWLHEFAIDCMRFGLEHSGFDTMTIVDSDQLGLRAGYSAFIRDWLSSRQGVGMLGSGPAPLDGRPIPPPAVQALHEFKLWRPFLRRFERGESKYVHWTFWPTTVFTGDAARALVGVWPDATLQALLKRTRIWASEEVILPTLVALLGFSVLVNPCRQDCVRYRVRFTPEQLDEALSNDDAFWVHPIERRYDDPLRVHVRRRLANYERADDGTPVAHLQERVKSRLVPILPILDEIRPIEGWLTDEEADLLIATLVRALSGRGPQAIVEIGSYCGKATVALARASQAIDPSARLCTIDAHDGVVGARDGRLEYMGATLHKLESNLERAGLRERVELHVGRASEVVWGAPIQLLLIDGLHDYPSVSEDFEHFARWVTAEGYVVFHDYAHYFPGVRRFVDELLGGSEWVRVRAAGSLIVLQRQRPAEPCAWDDSG